MGQIARDEKQLTLIFSSNTRVGKRAYAYLEGLDNKRFLAIDISKTKVPDTQWVEIADALDIPIGDLVDKKILELDTDTDEFSPDDWLKILQKNDKALYYPIAIKGNVTRQIVNSTELLEFYEVDSAGLEQSPSNDTPPDIERTTQDENFIEKKK